MAAMHVEQAAEQREQLWRLQDRASGTDFGEVGEGHFATAPSSTGGDDILDGGG